MYEWIDIDIDGLIELYLDELILIYGSIYEYLNGSLTIQIHS